MPHATGHKAPFPILADKSNTYYRQFGIEHSIAGMLKGMITRAPTLMYAILRHGFIPTTVGGSVTTMPADFLVGGNGVIQHVYYGQDEGDHLPIDTVVKFSKHGTV